MYVLMTCSHDKELTGYTNVFENGYKNPGIINGRSSGGLLLYIKENLFKHVKILKNPLTLSGLR